MSLTFHHRELLLHVQTTQFGQNAIKSKKLWLQYKCQFYPDRKSYQSWNKDKSCNGRQIKKQQFLWGHTLGEDLVKRDLFYQAPNFWNALKYLSFCHVEFEKHIMERISIILAGMHCKTK